MTDDPDDPLLKFLESRGEAWVREHLGEGGWGSSETLQHTQVAAWLADKDARRRGRRRTVIIVILALIFLVATTAIFIAGMFNTIPPLPAPAP
jgi:hypothetical protein